MRKVKVEGFEDIALFHQFGINHEEYFETGVGHYSTAIIELNDGTIKEVPAGNIKFLTQEEDVDKKEIARLEKLNGDYSYELSKRSVGFLEAYAIMRDHCKSMDSCSQCEFAGDIFGNCDIKESVRPHKEPLFGREKT